MSDETIPGMAADGISNERHAEDAQGSSRPLTPAARRALDEAAARRAAQDAHARELAARAELHGRGGLDPVRYTDWEIDGRAVDF